MSGAPGEDTEALVVVSGGGGGGGVLALPTVMPNAKWELYMVWFSLASLAATLALFWTDFFTTLGKVNTIIITIITIIIIITITISIFSSIFFSYMQFLTLIISLHHLPIQLTLFFPSYIQP